jgi:hypothetical protein
MTRSPDALLAQRLLALFCGGWLLFGYPLLSLWLADREVLGLPLLPAALFAGWALVIALLAVLMERRDSQAPGRERD